MINNDDDDDDDDPYSWGMPKTVVTWYFLECLDLWHRKVLECHSQTAWICLSPKQTARDGSRDLKWRRHKFHFRYLTTAVCWRFVRPSRQQRGAFEDGDDARDPRMLFSVRPSAFSLLISTAYLEKQSSNWEACKERRKLLECQYNYDSFY